MINLGDHTKTDEPPVGIAITWVESKLIQWYGSMKTFERYLFRKFKKEGLEWRQELRKPKYDVLYVYIIVNGVVRWRVNFVAWENGEVIMTGPLVPAPIEICKKGFQGFRYTSLLF